MKIISLWCNSLCGLSVPICIRPHIDWLQENTRLLATFQCFWTKVRILYINEKSFSENKSSFPIVWGKKKKERQWGPICYDGSSPSNNIRWFIYLLVHCNNLTQTCKYAYDYARHSYVKLQKECKYLCTKRWKAFGKHTCSPCKHITLKGEAHSTTHPSF